jgi:hypothetical protein
MKKLFPRPNAAKCTKGRFFDRASDKLNQLTRFATNELVSFDLHAMAAALGDERPNRTTHPPKHLSERTIWERVAGAEGFHSPDGNMCSTVR